MQDFQLASFLDSRAVAGRRYVLGCAHGGAGAFGRGGGVSTNVWVPKDVFISYRREERPRVLLIAKTLKELCLTVWFDAALEPGSTFDEEIAREISSARAVIVCWSKGAIASPWVRSEAMLAAGRRILIPVFLESCEPLPPFNLDHTEDLSDWSGQSGHAGWLKILSRIGVLVDRQDALVTCTAAQANENAEQYRQLIKRFPTDPLAAAAKQHVWEIEFAATRQRLSDELGVLPHSEPASSHQIRDLAERLGKAESRAHDAEQRRLRAEIRAREAEERLNRAYPIHDAATEGVAMDPQVVESPASRVMDAWDNPKPSDDVETTDEKLHVDSSLSWLPWLPWLLLGLVFALPLGVLAVILLH